MHSSVLRSSVYVLLSWGQRIGQLATLRSDNQVRRILYQISLHYFRNYSSPQPPEHRQIPRSSFLPMLTSLPFPLRPSNCSPPGQSHSSYALCASRYIRGIEAGMHKRCPCSYHPVNPAQISPLSSSLGFRFLPHPSTNPSLLTCSCVKVAKHPSGNQSM